MAAIIETPPPVEPSAEALTTLLCGTEEIPGLLDKLNLSVEQFARAVGVTRASVYYYLRNRTKPTPNTLAKMANVLDVPYEQMLTYITPRPMGRARKDSQ